MTATIAALASPSSIAGLRVEEQRVLDTEIRRVHRRTRARDARASPGYGRSRRRRGLTSGLYWGSTIRRPKARPCGPSPGASPTRTARGTAVVPADMSPFVSPSPLKPSCRAKVQRNHYPRVGFESLLRHAIRPSTPDAGQRCDRRRREVVAVLPRPVTPRTRAPRFAAHGEPRPVATSRSSIASDASKFPRVSERRRRCCFRLNAICRQFAWQWICPALGSPVLEGNAIDDGGGPPWLRHRLATRSSFSC